MKRLFIANRGEIARRIASSAKHLGIEVVAITDRKMPPEYLSPFVDHFVRVDHESPALYLNPEKMVALAVATGCDSLHPGFGFLSENAAFARQVEAARLTWIGPPPKAIDAMASKETARSWALKSHVPVVPGLSTWADQTGSSGKSGLSLLKKFADQEGFPLLLKAALGGGGKGMRLVYAMEELASAAERAASEALSSFGDSTLICEKYVETSRHVEVQILGDHHGNIVTVGDRDCSVQRRHQKIIEEAPAPDLNPETRRLLHEAALKLARQVGYTNAGTVEFLVDWSEIARTQKITPFYFLEMNTRLQVEHPVTEEVYGIDLVEWQLRIARGEPLPQWFMSAEKGFAPRGHSVEVRIYAEDPSHNFLPAPGPMPCFKPAQGPGIRWELGLDSSDEITGNFDPMIAKLVTRAGTRADALKLCSQTLRRSLFFGPPNNTNFLRTILDDTPFAHSPQATLFLGKWGERIQEKTSLRHQKQESIALEILEKLPDLMNNASAEEEKSVVGPGSQGFTPQKITQRAFQTLQIDKLNHEGLSSSSHQGTFEHQAQRLGELTNIDLCTFNHGIYSIGPKKVVLTSGYGLIQKSATEASGNESMFWYASMRDFDQLQLWVQINGETFTKALALGRKGLSHASGEHLADQDITAPVPGKIVSLNVSNGQSVIAGTVLLVLESMKMEFEIKAPQDMIIDQLKVNSGDQVSSGQKLVEFTPRENVEDS